MNYSRFLKANNQMQLMINGVAYPTCGYMSYNPQAVFCNEFKAAGYSLFFVPVYSGNRGINPVSGIRPFHKGFVTENGEYDFTSAEELFDNVIGDSKPGQVYIIPRLMLDPPTFWENENKSELCLDQNGESFHQSFSSSKWLKYAVSVMEAFEEWLEANKYNDYIVGWHLAGGWTEEFMRPMRHETRYMDYSTATKQSFIRWLSKKYSQINELNASWSSSYSSFDEIAIPSPNLIALNIDNNKLPIVADYNRFFNEETANVICYLAKEAKRITNDRIVIGAFYGYSGVRFGHSALEIILNSPYVDFLASPFSYDTGREPGTDWVILGMIDSCIAHGKAWFMECDVRTNQTKLLKESMPHAAPLNNALYESAIWRGPSTEETSINLLKMVLAKTISHKLSMWWFDMWGGWFSSDKMMDFMKKSYMLYEEISSGDIKSNGEIAVFINTHADETYRDSLSPNAFLQKMGHIGAPVEYYSITDFGVIQKANIKSIVLFNVYSLTENERAKIKEYEKQGIAIIHIASRQLTETYDLRTYGSYHYFSHTPEITTLRNIFKDCGCTIYCDTNDLIFSIDNMIAIHACEDGAKSILANTPSLKDYFSKEEYAVENKRCILTMKKGETKLLVF